MHLITLMGPPAVGKHTVGKLVAARANYKLFHNHLTVDLALSLFDYGTEGFFPLMADLRLRCFEAVASSTLRGMVFTCAFAFPGAEEFASKIERIVVRHQGRCDFVRLTCPVEDLENRVGGADRQKFGKIADSVKLQSAIEEFNLLDVLPGKEALTVNTSEMAPVEACEAICKRLIPVLGI